MSVSHRHLPHLYGMEQPLFVTFRLHGSLPPGRQFPKDSISSGKAFVCMDRLLDNHRSSPMYLQAPNIAQCVVDAIQQGGATSYKLHAWVVMPNHVHLLITPRTDVPKLLQMLKGSTARQANQLLGRTGTPFWQEESYDQLGAELARVWPHRKLYRSKPGASRAGSSGGRIPVVKRFEMRRAEARCRLKPAPLVVSCCRLQTSTAPCSHWSGRANRGPAASETAA